MKIAFKQSFFNFYIPEYSIYSKFEIHISMVEIPMFYQFFMTRVPWKLESAKNIQIFYIWSPFFFISGIFEERIHKANTSETYAKYFYIIALYCENVPEAKKEKTIKFISQWRINYSHESRIKNKNNIGIDREKTNWR